MRSSRVTAPLAVVLALAASVAAPQPARAAEYTMATVARYEVQVADRRLAVGVDVTFTNTTPDPAGQFSVFTEVKLPVHRGAAAVAASDDAGALEVSVADENGVPVATVALREALRYEATAAFTLTYVVPDAEGGETRIGTSFAVFPVWGFGTSSEVSVVLPAVYEVRADGDPLVQEPDASGTVLVSGPIVDPTRWLAVVTASSAATDYTTLSASVPLAGGTADLQVRAFVDDETWGEQTLEVLERALPLLEARLGIPYASVGPLVVTETVAAESAGFGEATAEGGEILVSFDQPAFTAIHQVSHIWLSPPLIASRWLAEGLASNAAAAVAAELGIPQPYDPAVVTAEGTPFPLDAWPAAAAPADERFGYAAAWAFVNELEAAVGASAVQRVLQRAAADIHPYAPDGEEAPDSNGVEPAPLTSRSFLDHLESVSGAAIAERYAAVVLAPDDALLLPERTSTRGRFAELVGLAGDWDAPDPVRERMAAWQFVDAGAAIDQAMAWLAERDALLAAMAEVGLSAPERLRDHYREYGGGPDAQVELDAERAVVDAYRVTLAAANEERSIIERVGLLGGPDPEVQLTVANGRFAEGDLVGATAAIAEAQRVLAGADPTGWVRLVSLAILVLVLAGVAAVFVRRRALTEAGA